MHRHRNSPSDRYGTIENFKLYRWLGIKQRVDAKNTNPDLASYRNNNIKIKMTKQEFYDFCDANKRKIITMYKKANGDRRLVPSVGRIDHDKDYSIGNISIILNWKNASDHRFHVKKPIVGVHISLNKIKRFRGVNTKDSIKANLKSSELWRICNKKKGYGNKHRNYYWFYENDPCLHELLKKRNIKLLVI